MKTTWPSDPGRAAKSRNGSLNGSDNGRHGHPDRLGGGLRLEDQESLDDLMVAIKKGSTRALQRLMNELWSGMVRFAARELGDRELAEDVVQDSFVYVWTQRQQWTPGGSVRAYVYRIVRNRMIDETRKRKVRRRWARSPEGAMQSSPIMPDQAMNCSVITRTFNEAVAALPERRREAFSLVFLRGLSHEEAAAVLGISKQTVSNQVTAALKDVRAAISTVSDALE